jgi:hypothetical protein
MSVGFTNELMAPDRGGPRAAAADDELLFDLSIFNYRFFRSTLYDVQSLEIL